MIRARDSLDRWATAAHQVLDQSQKDPTVPGHHISWALAYLGDRAGSCAIPRDIQSGYDYQGFPRLVA